MNKFSVLALVALSAMAGIASSQNSSQSGASDGSMEGTGSNHADASHDGHDGHDDGAAVTNSGTQGGMQGGGMQQNGMQQNGMQQNGMQQNGMQQNGMQQNGMQQNGMQQNGMQQNGMQQSPVSVDVQAAGHSEMEGGGGMFEMFSAAEQKELGVGNKGDKCKGFKLFFASQAAEQKCQAFDTETACEAGGCEYQCNFKVNNVCKQAKCQPSDAATQKIMGVEMDMKKMQAEVQAELAPKMMGKTPEEQQEIMKDTMKEAMKKYLKPMVPVMNDLNTTMVEIAKFMKRCGGGKTKAACAADKVCELQLAFNASTNNFTQQCNVNKAKAVEETGCSGVARAVADLDALERKAVAAGAKKALAGKQKKQKGAKDAVEEYKKANPTATADTDTALKALETQAASADAEVIAASATVTTADAAATAAEQKAAATPADSSTLRALPSIMAVVAATVAAAFA